jgi:hypothetical protein
MPTSTLGIGADPQNIRRSRKQQANTASFPQVRTAVLESCIGDGGRADAVEVVVPGPWGH